MFEDEFAELGLVRSTQGWMNSPSVFQRVMGKVHYCQIPHEVRTFLDDVGLKGPKIDMAMLRSPLLSAVGSLDNTSSLEPRVIINRKTDWITCKVLGELVDKRRHVRITNHDTIEELYIKSEFTGILLFGAETATSIRSPGEFEHTISEFLFDMIRRHFLHGFWEANILLL